ncbi:sugar ABC transporter ATP-binding protein [Caballeronia sp. GAFFF1]|uniref:sugar ABC transporter ATP-binding protein n=1 Tax=Caballeronia sp. GAFFF1 TaxID=2921779 RepID=UPI002028AD53|nr:sugar ABC transporter ATP-binding protein [Caballeronia sp. GAFFF1]
MSKTFPGTRALDNVSLDIRAGEIHALVGGNGSGKSTLIKILSGVYKGDPGGSLRIDDLEIRAEETSPALARKGNVHVVHQDLGVFLDMSVSENLALGSHYERGWSQGIDWRALKKRSVSLIRKFEINAAPDAELRSLGPAVRTQVAIARALQGQADSSSGLLILDEPTASLPAHEVEALLAQLKRYAAQGQAILYVSHRLDEILAIADRVSALRDGKLVGTYDASAISEKFLIELIVGDKVQSAARAPSQDRRSNVRFEAKDLAVGPLRGVAFDVHEGEIVGVAGLLGSGRTELLRSIFGDLPLSEGEMRLDGSAHRPVSPSAAIQAGVIYVPEDRVNDAAFMDQTIASNIAMPALHRYFNGGRIKQDQIDRDASEDIKEFLVKANDGKALLSTLSGGNQQKVVMARWLRLRPRLMLLDEPTQGVDIGARAEIYKLIRAATDGGSAAIVVASDFEELTAVCDRILVIREGRVFAELQGSETTPHEVAQLTLGL